MHLARLAITTAATLALVVASACEKSTTGASGGSVTCTDSPVCPPANASVGYNGTSSTPTIVPTSGGTSVSVSSSVFAVTGTTNSSLNGYWLLVQNGVVRAWNVLTVSTGNYAATIPLFCGEQQVYYAFTNGAGTSYYLTNVTLTGCTGSSQFRVQLTWVSSPTSDLDLHLLRPSGLFNSANDCYYGNCKVAYVPAGLEWGATGAAGNPSLDVDDTDGFGPENITIASGAETGDFRVIIYDFDGTVGEVATVRIYFNDVEVAKYTSLAMDNAGRAYWQVAKVNVGTRTVTPVNTYSATAPTTAGTAPVASPSVK